MTPFGLVTYFILFFIRLNDRKIHIAGITTNPNETWMAQMAHNLTNPETGYLPEKTILLHDRDGKYTAHFNRLLNEYGIEIKKLPAGSPNLNAYAERFVRTIKEQCLSRMIVTSEEQLRKVCREFTEFYHHERAHQGIGNVIPFPRTEDNVGSLEGKITRKSRLGNLLNSYFRVKNEPKPLEDQRKVAI